MFILTLAGKSPTLGTAELSNPPHIPGKGMGGGGGGGMGVLGID